MTPTSSARLPPASVSSPPSSCAAQRRTLGRPIGLSPMKRPRAGSVLLSDLFDAGRDLLGGRVWCAGLHGHELRHVALHLDLAGHERLHPGLRVALDEDRL